MDQSTLNTSSSSTSSAPVPSTSSTLSSSINQLPPVASVPTSQQIPNGNSSSNESATSLQTSFESLSLQTPLKPTLSNANGQSQAMATPSIQANYDYKGHDESIDPQGIDPSFNDGDGNDESSEGTRGSYRS